MNDTRTLIADALLDIVEQARCGSPVVRIGLMAHGSELGDKELLQGALAAQRETPGLKVVAIGKKPETDAADLLEWIDAPPCEADIVAAMEEALEKGRIAGAVALHYPFPVGVATIGRVVTPGRARPLLIASCTGATSSVRSEALLRNALYGTAVARALGIANPEVGLLNLDGASSVLRVLHRMRENGYPITFGASERKDGGSLLRGNDLVAGAGDVLVCDSLTGNALVKIFSTFTTGGHYESIGWGYGPSVGENWKHVVSIISRSSGAPVIAGALAFTARLAAQNLPALVASELASARSAGLESAISELKPKAPAAASIAPPPAIPVDAELHGIDVLDMEAAAQELWKAGIYAETAMGCTGPIVRIASAAKEKAAEILRVAGYM